MTAVPAVTSTVAEFAISRNSADFDSKVLDAAERAFVDTVGVALAAAQDATAIMALDALRRRLSSGTATVLATGAAADAQSAALVNGAAAHALDYDDVTDSIKGHPSTVLVPALLAAAEETHSDGRALLEAYCVGFQVECAVADALGIASHYRRGWHATSTVGVIAAAAAAARLLGLDVPATRCAIGIAGSMASGSRQNFGTMTKPLHAGLAASNAVLAANLAASGFTADVNQLEAPLGYFALYGQDDEDGPDLSRLQPVLQAGWLLSSRGLNVKRYPCCYNTHRTGDAVLALRQERGRGADDIDSVHVTLEPGALGPLIHHRPQTGLEGKFSAEYVVAAALLDGKLTLKTFTDDAVRRDAAQSLLRRITTEEASTPPSGPAEWQGGYAVVTVREESGRTIERRVDVPSGHASASLSDDELQAKFDDCIQFSGAPLEVKPLFDRLRHLRNAPTLTDLVWTTAS